MIFVCTHSVVSESTVFALCAEIKQFSAKVETRGTCFSYIVILRDTVCVIPGQNWSYVLWIHTHIYIYTIYVQRLIAGRRRIDVNNSFENNSEQFCTKVGSRKLSGNISSTVLLDVSECTHVWPFFFEINTVEKFYM